MRPQNKNKQADVIVAVRSRWGRSGFGFGIIEIKNNKNEDGDDRVMRK